MPEPDEVTLKANELYNFMARWPYESAPPDITFLMNLVGIRVGSEMSQKVWERVLTRVEVEREYREKTAPPAQGNGHLGPEQVGQ